MHGARIDAVVGKQRQVYAFSIMTREPLYSVAAKVPGSMLCVQHSMQSHVLAKDSGSLPVASSRHNGHQT